MSEILITPGTFFHFKPFYTKLFLFPLSFFFLSKIEVKFVWKNIHRPPMCFIKPVSSCDNAMEWYQPKIGCHEMTVLLSSESRAVLANGSRKRNNSHLKNCGLKVDTTDSDR